MKPRCSKLYEIQNNRPISPEADPAFFRLLRTGLLLTLREQGTVSQEQVNSALERLDSDEGRKV